MSCIESVTLKQSQAEELERLGIACVMCVGTGGWPGPTGWTDCKVCDGEGKAKSPELSTKSCEL